MKKYIIIAGCLIVLYTIWNITYYRFGWYMDFNADDSISIFTKTKGTEILMKNPKSDSFDPFEIRGVNLGSGVPGEWSADFAISKRTYLKWFSEIQEMGANTIRVYTIQTDDFYEAFYEYNKDREEPLYLLHGVWVNDYMQNSHRDAYDDDLLKNLEKDCQTLVDVLHGKKQVLLGRSASSDSGTYRKDVSKWVIGYILGVEWEDWMVAYTDDIYKGVAGYTEYRGDYMYTVENASPFECMLARVGDGIISYETERYNEQRLVAFTNWNTTDPFEWQGDVKNIFQKCAKIDVEHIKTTKKFLSGQFASYHVYPYYPDYLNYEKNWERMKVEKKNFMKEDGTVNTYRAYLSMLTKHHSMPVVISEFGVSTGRGMAQRDENTGRNQGNMSENEQGDALIQCWEDIKAVGCNGGCIFSWQDEWFKRTWNTMYAVDLKRTPYWSDYQTNEQFFGLLSFDPGKEESICYVDGDVLDWEEKEIVKQTDTMTLSMKYDEKFIYFLIQKKNLKFSEDEIYLPFDITPKTGSNYCENYKLSYDREADFILVINGKDNSRLQVQERYEALRANYAQNVYGFDTYEKKNIPSADSTKFVDINMVLQISRQRIKNELQNQKDEMETFETGKLTYGNANPKSEDFNSLADFICKGENIELRLPWQILNFADPSKMEIHDDYYDGNYGVRYQNIKKIYVGIGDAAEDSISLTEFRLRGWRNRVTYHERLKSSYYIMKDFWKENQGK